MRVLVTQPTEIEVEPKKYATLDAHHEYYLDDKQAQKLIAKGAAVELDSHGKPVQRQAAKQPAGDGKAGNPQAPEAVSADGPAGKPGSTRTTKAVKPPANKASEKNG